MSIYVTFMSIEHSVWYLLLKNSARGCYSKAKPSICFVECNINLDSTNSQVLVFTRSLPIISSIQNQWEHRERTPQRNRCYFTKDSRVSFWTATCVLPFNITSHPSLLFPSLSDILIISSRVDCCSRRHAAGNKTKKAKENAPLATKGDIYDNLPMTGSYVLR